MQSPWRHLRNHTYKYLPRTSPKFTAPYLGFEKTYFILFEFVSAYMYVPYESSEATETRSGFQIPWKWDYCQL